MLGGWPAVAEQGLVETSRLWPKLARPIHPFCWDGLIISVSLCGTRKSPRSPANLNVVALPLPPSAFIHLPVSVFSSKAPVTLFTSLEAGWFWSASSNSPRLAAAVLSCTAPVRPWLGLWACMHASIVPCMHPAHVRRRHASMPWVAPREIGSRLTLEACRPGRLSRPWCIAISPLQLMHWPPAAGASPVRPKSTDRCAVCNQVGCRHLSANRRLPRCCSVHLVFCSSSSCSLP